MHEGFLAGIEAIVHSVQFSSGTPLLFCPSVPVFLCLPLCFQDRVSGDRLSTVTMVTSRSWVEPQSFHILAPILLSLFFVFGSFEIFSPRCSFLSDSDFVCHISPPFFSFLAISQGLLTHVSVLAIFVLLYRHEMTHVLPGTYTYSNTLYKKLSIYYNA